MAVTMRTFADMVDADIKAVKLAPLSNIIGMKLNRGNGEITIGVDEETFYGLERGGFYGGLLLVDKTAADEFAKNNSLS